MIMVVYGQAVGFCLPFFIGVRMRKYKVMVLESYTVESTMVLHAADEKDLKARIEDIIDGKRRRMNADEATVFAVEILEDIITH